MKNLKFIGFIMLIVFAVSCKKENPVPTPSTNPMEGLQLAQTISNSTHKIDLYTVNGKLEQGYNKIYFQIKGADGTALKNATPTWKTLMHMTSMSHASPYSAITTSNKGETVYEGYIVFQMASNATEYWDLTIDYTINGTSYSITEKVTVVDQTKRRVVSFKGTDNVKYIVALVNPTQPKVGLNDMEALVFKMEDMMTFPIVDGYSVVHDPRMPGMGNHGSPNNVNLTQKSAGGSYTGKLSLTMTGYWVINLQLLNTQNEVLKGEAVSESVEKSSIYFEVEF